MSTMLTALAIAAAILAVGAGFLDPAAVQSELTLLNLRLG